MVSLSPAVPGRRLLAIVTLGGGALGLALRAVPNDRAWLMALLALSAVLVAVAQQTLP